MDPSPWRWVALGGAGTAALLLLTLGGWAWWGSYQARGLAELDRALLKIQPVQDVPAPAEPSAEAIRALQSVIDGYPRLKALPQAAYQLGNLHYQAKAFDEARRAYELALDRGAAGTLATLSRVGIAYTWEAQGEYGKALAAFEAALKGRTAKDFLYEELLLDAARAHELLKQPDRAREAYQRLLNELPQSRRADHVRARLASLPGS